MATQSQGNISFQLLTKGLEVVNPDRMSGKLQAGSPVKGFWATAPTGKPHVGYLVPLIKIAEFIRAGFQLTLLVVDHYAYAVNYDVSLETIEHRTQYYIHLLTAVLRALGVADSQILILKESSFSTSAQYQRDLMRLCAATRQDEIRAVGDEFRDTPMVSPWLCPMRQALDEVHLGSDFQLGGLDQRGIFNYTTLCLPRIGYELATHLMSPMIPGLKSGKMSSSAPADTKIMFTETNDSVEKKIAGADLPSRDHLAGNGIMAMFEHIVFPFHRLRSSKEPSVRIGLAGRLEKQYGDFGSLKDDVTEGVVDAESLRRVLAKELNNILGPVREEYAMSAQWRRAEELGYEMVDMAGMRV